MILIGRDLSPFVRRVAVSLQVMNLPFERRELSTADNAAEIRELNPLGRVPALVIADDEPALIDSWAILDYLDHEVAPERALVPSEGDGRREVLRLVAIGTGATEKAVSSFYERTRRPKETVHQPYADHLDGQVAAGLRALDLTIGDRDWLVGGNMTQADITAVCLWDFLSVTGKHLHDAARFPKLAAFAERVLQHPAFQATSLDRFRG